MDNLKGNPDPVNPTKMVDPDSSKAVTTNVIDKKSGRKSSNMRLVSEDAKSVGSYVMVDIIIPKIKELITSGFKYAIDFIFYGTKKTKNSNSGIGTVSYSSYYTGNAYQSGGSYSNPMVSRTNNIFKINEYVFPEREDAERVLLALNDTIMKYGSASVGDFYDFVSKPHSFQDLKYGWKDLRDSEILRVSDGFSIRFPQVTPLE